MTPKEMIIYEQDPYDSLMVLKEKKGRIKSYQGFNKKDLLKPEGKEGEQKSKPSREHKKIKISQTVHHSI